MNNTQFKQSKHIHQFMKTHFLNCQLTQFNNDEIMLYTIISNENETNSYQYQNFQTTIELFAFKIYHVDFNDFCIVDDDNNAIYFQTAIFVINKTLTK